MEERRKFFRFESSINVNYTKKENGRHQKAIARNISREGVGLSTDNMLAREEIIKLEFEIPGDNIPAFAEGIVAWVEREEDKKKRPFNVGVRLTNMTGFDRSRILEYVYTQWLKLKNLKVLKP